MAFSHVLAARQTDVQNSKTYSTVIYIKDMRYRADHGRSNLSQTTLNDVARMMNDRPRKTLGWRTPAEAMAEELAAIKSTVALQT